MKTGKKIKGKEKRNVNATDIRASLSKNKDGKRIIVKGNLHGPNINIEIIAKPEDWLIFRNWYLAFRKEVYKGLFPFIQGACLFALPKPKFKLNSLMNLLRVQSALLYYPLIYIFEQSAGKGILLNFSSLNEALKYIPEENKEPMCYKNNEYDSKLLALYFMEKVYDGYCEYNKLTPFKNMTVKEFQDIYVYKGEKIVKSNSKLFKEAISDIASMLYLINTDPFKKDTRSRGEKEEVRYIISFMKNLTAATTNNFKSIINRKRMNELKNLQNIYKTVFPSIPIPLR